MMKTDQPRPAAFIEGLAEALVILDLDGRCIYVNRHAERLLHAKSEELCGKILWQTVSALSGGWLLEECRHSIREQKKRVCELRVDQLGSWWECSLFPAHDSISIHIRDISDRKRREEELRLCEESYSRLIKSLGGIVWVADASTLRFLYVSEQATKVLGYPVQQWLEEPDFWSNHLHPEDRERYTRSRMDAVVQMKETVCEYRMIAADQREVWLHETVLPHRHEGGSIRLRGIMLEITAKKELEKDRDRLLHDLENRVKEFSALAGVGGLLQSSDHTREAVLRELVRSLPPAFQYPEAVEARVTMGEVWIATENFRDLPDMLCAQSCCASGTLCRVEVAYVEPEPKARSGSFLPQEQLLLQSIADLLRLAEDRREALEALAKREELFRTLVHSSRDSFTILGEDRHILYQSPTIEQMSGYSPEELIGHSASEFIHPDDREAWEEFLCETLATEDTQILVEYRCRDRDGLWRIFESKGKRIVDEHGQTALVINTRDVTLRSEAERLLRESERRFRLLFEKNAAGMVICDAEFRIWQANPAFCSMLGYSEHELIQRTVLDVTHPEDRAATVQIANKMKTGREGGDIEKRYLRKDGSTVWAHTSSIVSSSGDGVPLCIATIQNITSSKTATEALRLSEQRYRSLLLASAPVVWLTDPSGAMFQGNSSWCALTGQTDEECRGWGWIFAVHPEDRERVREEWALAVKEKRIYQIEYRLRISTGEYHYFAVRGAPVFDDGRGIREWVGTCTDITDRKRAELDSQTWRNRYDAAVWAVGQVLYDWDMTGEAVAYGGNIEQVLGYSAAEISDGGPRLFSKLIQPEDRVRVYRAIVEVRRSRQPVHVELRLRQKDGAYRVVRLDGQCYRDERQNAYHMVGFISDITERKRAENEVLTWKNRYDAAVLASWQLLYDWDMMGEEVVYGGNTDAVLGYSLSEMRQGSVSRWIHRVHPDDRRAFREQVEYVKRTHQPFHLEYRLRHKDGSYRIVQDHGQCYVDQRGNVYRLTGFVTDITERVEMEQRLRASEDRFRRIFEEAGVGMVVMDLQQHFLQVNPAYCNMTGYTPEELKAMSERDLMHSDDLPAHDHLLREVLDGKRRVIDLDKRCIRKDGTEVWGHMTTVFPSMDGKPAYCVAVIQDITARKHAEEEVRRRDRFFRSLIENSSDNITVLNADGITLFQSPAIERQLGYSPEELVGRTNAELIHPDDRSKATRRLLEALNRGETKAPQTLRFRTKDGSWRILETVGKRFVDDTGDVVGIFNTRDVTDRVIAGELLQRAKQQAEAANLAKDRFLASLSHELRTPLTPVVAILPSLLQVPDLPDHVRYDLQMIKQNVELETRLIDDLLDLTRITQNKVRLNRQKIDAHELIQSTIEIVRSDADAKNVSVDLNLLARDHYITGDRVRLQQVLWNLLKNAIKFSRSGSRVSVESVNPDPKRIRISVRDEGAGIEREQLPKIFDAFVQTLSGSGHQFGGLGLGLFISRAMVERHAGTIEVESEGVGKGATFKVTLDTVPEGAVSQPEIPAPTKVHADTPLRILLVEDHENTREVLSRLLKRQGHTVLAAQSVEEALHVADENKVDIAISDLGLPDGSGLDLMPQLRSRYGLKGIAVSGYGMESDLKNSREAGFGAHLVKPVDFKQLQTALHDITVSQQT